MIAVEDASKHLRKKVFFFSPLGTLFWHPKEGFWDSGNIAYIVYIYGFLFFLSPWSDAQGLLKAGLIKWEVMQCL